MVAGGPWRVHCAGVIAWAMLRFNRSLPIGNFFAYSSWLMAGPRGKGDFRSAGGRYHRIAPVPSVPSFSVLGLFPTAQIVAAQLMMLVPWPSALRSTGGGPSDSQGRMT